VGCRCDGQCAENGSGGKDRLHTVWSLGLLPPPLGARNKSHKQPQGVGTEYLRRVNGRRGPATRRL
jgi:hypothetical protein